MFGTEFLDLFWFANWSGEAVASLPPPPPPQWLRTFYDKGQDSLFSKKTTLNIEWKKEILSDRSLRSV